MELVYILLPIFGFVLAKMVLEHRATARRDNVRLLEEALKNPSLDRATLESLAWQLTGARPPRGSTAPRSMAIVLALGWIAVFTGIGLWILGQLIGEQETLAGGVLTALIGFGLVTYPFALRELEARHKS